jgi:hypothetical protein
MPLDVVRLTGDEGRETTKGFAREMLLKPATKEGVKGVFASDLARLRFGVFGCPYMKEKIAEFGYFN